MWVFSIIKVGTHDQTKQFIGYEWNVAGMFFKHGSISTNRFFLKGRFGSYFCKGFLVRDSPQWHDLDLDGSGETTICFPCFFGGLPDTRHISIIFLRPSCRGHFRVPWRPWRTCQATRRAMSRLRWLWRMTRINQVPSNWRFTGHRNSWFTYKKWGFSSSLCWLTRG